MQGFRDRTIHFGLFQKEFLVQDLNKECTHLIQDNFNFQFEADRRAFIITINSFGTELTKDDRAKLYPTCGKLNPDGLSALARADDYDQVKTVAEYYQVS